MDSAAVGSPTGLPGPSTDAPTGPGPLQTQRTGLLSPSSAQRLRQYRHCFQRPLLVLRHLFNLRHRPSWTGTPFNFSSELTTRNTQKFTTLLKYYFCWNTARHSNNKKHLISSNLNYLLLTKVSYLLEPLKYFNKRL